MMASTRYVACQRLSRLTRPTLDFVAGYTACESQSRSELNLRNHYSSTGQLYRVGVVSVLSSQASANRPKAQGPRPKDKLDATRQEVITGTTREYRGLQIGVLEKAVASNKR